MFTLRNPSVRLTCGVFAAALGLIQCAAAPADAPADRFGGMAVRIADPAKFFGVQKVGGRWLFATPEGNAFWMRAVYNVNVSGSVDNRGLTYTGAVTAKYGDANVTWGPQQNRRLLAWGFNSTAEYSSRYVQPTATSPAWPGKLHPVPMPFTILIWPSYYALRNSGNYAASPVKDLVQVTKPSVYSGWRAHSPDVWDPSYGQWLAGAIQRDYNIQENLTGPNNDYLVGINVDDIDWLQGFGAGPDFKTIANGIASGGREQPHLAWIILITPPTQTASSELGVSYADTKVYSKQALSEFLAARYGSISALNAAWKSTYSSFGSAGGWGSGTGLLDEDGAHSWVPKDFLRLSGGTSGFIQDMDDFLLRHAQKYFSEIRSVLNTYAPGRLYLGPTTLGTWGSPPRRQILQAAGPYLDAIGVYTLPGGVQDDQARIDFMEQYAGDKPWISWEGMMANPDSYFHAFPAPDEVAPQSATQARRGTVFASRLEALLQARTSNGIYPVAGFKYWELADNSGERANWGLVTRRDNAYDGREACSVRGQDRWGYATGGEDADYGDFLSSAAAANREAQDRIFAETAAPMRPEPAVPRNPGRRILPSKKK